MDAAAEERIGAIGLAAFEHFLATLERWRADAGRGDRRSTAAGQKRALETRGFWVIQFLIGASFNLGLRGRSKVLIALSRLQRRQGEKVDD